MDSKNIPPTIPTIPSIPTLHLENFLLPTAVPDNCPFVLTSPRSLQACEKVGIQPVDLLPSSLSDYAEAFPDLPREEVISIFREEEMEREEQLIKCREIRLKIISDETDNEERRIEFINDIRKTRKQSCLSPIVELKHSIEDSTDEKSFSQFSHGASFVQLIRRTSSLPTILVEDFSTNDQPEVDQHIQEDKAEMERLRIEESFFANFEAVPDSSEGNNSWESLGSSLSCNSELVMSGFSASLTPSPNMSCGSCNFSSSSSIENQFDRQAGGKRFVRSLSAENPFFSRRCELPVFENQLSIRKPIKGFHMKKKASRKTRITNESLTNLYHAKTSDHASSPSTSASPWPHSKLVTPVSPAKSNLLKSVLSRSDIDISALRISKQDLRLLEILAIRMSDDQKRRSRKEQLRVQWEKERIKRETEKNISEKEYKRYLKNKRCRDEEESQRRINIAREGFLRSQEYLRQLLQEKDERKRRLVRTLQMQKESLIKDHRVSEEEKRLMVDQAVSDLMARDTQYREELRIEVNKKLEKAAVNKNLQDTKKYQTIAESNRQEAQDHQQRMKKLEEIYSDHIEKSKVVIDTKFKKAKQVREQEKMKLGNRRGNSRNHSNVLSLKAELDSKLDLWRKHVLSVQSLSILKAEERVRKNIQARKEKIAGEIKNKEERFKALKNESEAKNLSKFELQKQKLEEKSQKVEKLVIDRNATLLQAKRLAENSTKLRELIKEQLY